MSCSLSSELRPAVRQSPLPSAERAPVLDSVDAGHPSLVDAFDSAARPVRYPMLMEEVEDEDAVQRVGDLLHSGNHLLERNDEVVVRYPVSIEEVEDEDAVQCVGDILPSGSHLLERNDDVGVTPDASPGSAFDEPSLFQPPHAAPVASNFIPGALPLVVKDCVHSDAQDMLSFISTYRLRKSFEFSALLSEGALHPSDVYPSGDFVVVDATVSLLVEHFPHLTKNQLMHLGRDHSVDFLSGARKEVYRHLLLTHCCSAACTRTPFVFRNLSHPRVDTAKPVFPSSEELDRHKRTRIETRRRQQNARRVARSQSHAREVIEGYLSAADKTAADFPPSVTTGERNSIIAKWMEVMDLKNFTQMSCAVCGQRRCAKDIKQVSSTKYDIRAYDGAILWHKGLHDCARRGDLDMCVSCRHELVSLCKQPLDSLANFQYYGYEALSDEVREAFDHATTFDIMMVARARATRITHLYSSKTEGPMAGSDPEISQSYNKGNVAILPQDSMELRNALPPPFDDIQKAMCAVFVGSRSKP